MEHREVVRALVIILYSLTTPAGATRHPSGNHPQNFPNFAGPDRGELAPHFCGVTGVWTLTPNTEVATQRSGDGRSLAVALFVPTKTNSVISSEGG